MQALIATLVLAVALLAACLITWMVVRLRAREHRRDLPRAGRFSGPWRWRG